MFIYRLNRENIVLDIISDVISIKNNTIYTSDGHVISGIIGNEKIVATEQVFKIEEFIDENTVPNMVENLKKITGEEMITVLAQSLSSMNLENKMKDDMINVLSKMIAQLNIEVKQLQERSN